jgi:hypothetical protein
MKRKIVSILVCTLLITVLVLPVSAIINDREILTKNNLVKSIINENTQDESRSYIGDDNDWLPLGAGNKDLIYHEGKVGIGVTNPSDISNKLTVKGESMLLYNSGHILPYGIMFKSNGEISTTSIFKDSLKFQLDGGRVGIGTTPKYKLDVAGKCIRLKPFGSSGSLPDEKEIMLRVDGSEVDLVANKADLFLHSWDKNTIIQNFGGKVGIGMSKPSDETKLQVRLHKNNNFGILVDAIEPGSEIGLHSNIAGFSSLAKNCYWDNGWKKFNPDGGAFLQEINPDGEVGFYTTSSDKPDIDWNQVLTLKTNGHIKCDVIEIAGGGDISEPFDIKEEEKVLPGMVLSIDKYNPGKLKISEKAYDKCVAGIVSGAGGIEPGLIMSQTGTIADGEYPVALTGRVFCWADASYGPIEPGDLLTTSKNPGYAMKVSNYTEAQGAIIGKSMTELKDGTGLILVLVSLQ